jgi:hypothetical protein
VAFFPQKAKQAVLFTVAGDKLAVSDQKIVEKDLETHLHIIVRHINTPTSL